MTMRRAGAGLALVLWASLAAAAGPPALPPGAERAYGVLAARVSAADARDVVARMDGTWRLAGNPAYDAALDFIRERLTAAGFSASAAAAATIAVEAFPAASPGWDYRVGTVAFADDPTAPLLSRERDHVSLAINSFSTAPGGVVAPLVDVGRGTAADYAGRSVRGAVVLTDAALGRVWRDAVVSRGAAGVISTRAAAFVRPEGISLTDAQQDVLQWDSIPDDAAARSFGFKASRRAADRMRERLRGGPVEVRVSIESTFYDAPDRTLVAEIPGRSRPEERVVIAAHLQEPGANDNASGCGTLLALAVALRAAIASGALPPPDRTLTFLWLDETRGSEQWRRAHPAAAAGVQFMFALDMTGEDTARTGGSFLIEKQADPSAVWDRPSDPHTEWSQGSAGVSADSLRGSVLNDLFLAVCRRRGRDQPWQVGTNPYEGGSDHTVFGAAGVPAVLAWHFTDRYYHTNQDRIDKTSAAEMQNVAIATGATAWLLASATRRDAAAVADLLGDAGAARLALERSQGPAIVAAAADRGAALAAEEQIIPAWIKWYGEALDGVLRLPAGGADAAVRARVAAARRRLR